MSKKELDRQIERYFYKHGNGVQISIMDLGKITAEAREAFKQGLDIETQVIASIEKYRVN